jgi:hypothetical protein
VPNGSLTFVTGHLSRLNGTSDWYLRGHAFKYGTEDRQPSVLVKSGTMAPKISRILFYFFFVHRERWKVILKNLKEHTCFKRPNNRFTLGTGVIYFCAAAYKKYTLSYIGGKMWEQERRI